MRMFRADSSLNLYPCTLEEFVIMQKILAAYSLAIKALQLYIKAKQFIFLWHLLKQMSASIIDYL